MVDSVAVALGRPMPRAGAGQVRLVAARWAGLAGELRRVQEVLRAGLGRDLGWAGAAELAFEDSLRAELARCAPEIDRLEGQAAALAGYAADLAALEPGLRAARARLVDGSGLTVGGLAVGSGLVDGGGLAEFEARWRDWDTTRRRCLTRLTVGAAGHRHGWSGLLAAVTHTLAPGVTLAGLSRALADLGTALTVAGLVLALVCPPAAGAIWAALAIVAVCQLVVDATRRERGEQISAAGLGWEALGALPGGRWIREFHTAAEASQAIERLAPEQRYVHLVPGGGLKAHEGTATHRGHTLLKHEGKTTRQLARRFKTEPRLNFSSSFTDRATAEAAVAKTIEANHQAITEWLASPLPSLLIWTDTRAIVGKSVARDGTIIKTSKVRVALRKEDTVLGYYIKTAFPTP